MLCYYRHCHLQLDHRTVCSTHHVVHIWLCWSELGEDEALPGQHAHAHAQTQHGAHAARAPDERRTAAELATEVRDDRWHGQSLGCRSSWQLEVGCCTNSLLQTTLGIYVAWNVHGIRPQWCSGSLLCLCSAIHSAPLGCQNAVTISKQKTYCNLHIIVCLLVKRLIFVRNLPAPPSFRTATQCKLPFRPLFSVCSG